uniref:Interleukin 11 receptor subunit alpha n=1 Tax=Seriola lalandi dorsalis TaxID=1841481 RepID=A0A3B4XIN5_SERLL
GTQYGHLESNVTLACGKSQFRIPVVWHLNHSSALPWHKVTSDGALVLLHVGHSAQGIYSCYDNRGLLLHSVKLRLGHPPGLLSISCQVPNHTHVRCSWMESVKTFLPAQYNASFRGNGQEWMPCVMDVTRKHCDVDHPAFWQTIHTLRITETNALGSETTYVRFKLHELLKPNPPESVFAKELEGYPKRLIVSWNFPSSWPLHEAFPLVFQIRYRPQGSMYWSEVSKQEESPVVIFDALAGHLHQVQIRARDEVNADSQWSEWSPLLLVRPWEGQTENLQNTHTHTHTHMYATSTSHNGVISFSLIEKYFVGVQLLLCISRVRQRRRNHVTKQELTSMVKMKSMPI